MSPNVALQLSTRKFRILIGTHNGTLVTPGTTAIQGNPRRQSLHVMNAGNWSLVLGSQTVQVGQAGVGLSAITVFDRYTWGDFVTSPMSIFTDAVTCWIGETYIDEVPNEWQ